MAGLFSQAITAICLSAAPGAMYNDACNHAVDAGTRQIGMRDQVDRAEDTTTTIVAHKAGSFVGKKIATVVGAGGFVFRTVQSKRLSFGLPTLGICDSLSNEITPTSYILNIKWNLP